MVTFNDGLEARPHTQSPVYKIQEEKLTCSVKHLLGYQ